MTEMGLRLSDYRVAAIGDAELLLDRRRCGLICLLGDYCDLM